MQLGDGDCVSFMPEENNNDDCSHLVDIGVLDSELDPFLKIITFHLSQPGERELLNSILQKRKMDSEISKWQGWNSHQEAPVSTAFQNDHSLLLCQA